MGKKVEKKVESKSNDEVKVKSESKDVKTKKPKKVKKVLCIIQKPFTFNKKFYSKQTNKFSEDFADFLERNQFGSRL